MLCGGSFLSDIKMLKRMLENTGRNNFFAGYLVTKGMLNMAGDGGWAGMLDSLRASLPSWNQPPSPKRGFKGWTSGVIELSDSDQE